MTSKVALYLMSIIQPSSGHPEDEVRRISSLNFTKTANFSPKICLMKNLFLKTINYVRRETFDVQR
jgi:hypothetical protein